MGLSVTGKLYVGFFSAIILSIAIGIITYKAIENQQDNAANVKHTYQVLNQVDDIQNLMVDMETGRRGFRSTNLKKFLEPYNNGLLRIVPAIRDVKQLAADNPTQLNNINELEAKVRDMLQFWKMLGEDATTWDKDTITIIMDAEKIRMDAIRADIANIKHHETDLLLAREKKNQEGLKVTSALSICGTILILIIILILIYFILSEFSNRRRAEAEVQENLEEVRKLNEESTNRNWLLTGSANVNDSLQGKEDVQSLTDASLATLVEYLGAAAGAFYAYDAEEHKLILTAGHALPANATRSFELGEGLVGKAANGSDVVIVRNVPADYWAIKSASGQQIPGEILCIPLWYNNELKGVIEIASFHSFSDLQVALLNTIASNIAIAVNAADAREKVMQLLEQVQLQKLSLQNQQEELRQTNEELTRQAEVLQASEEELRVQEEELRQINAELEEKNEAVEVSRQALSQKAKELEVTGKYKSEFLANMSHELRTPLNSVLILAKILSENKQVNLTDKQIEYANIIHKSGTDLLNLINDILDLSKIEAGKIDFIFEEVSVASILKDVGQMFHVIAEEKAINFVRRKDEAAPDTIHTDKQRLEQVIKNMLSNAFKFTPKNGTITLSFDVSTNTAALDAEHLRKAAKVTVVSVTDTGIGIPKEKQQLIFEAFQQADGSTSRKYGGTGLGLSISKELLKKLGGEMKLVSEENRGSTFSIYLPLEKFEHAEREETTVNSAMVADIPEVPQKDIVEQTKVRDDRDSINKEDDIMLIIEDDPQFATIVQEFARNKQYKTIVALQGDEGLYYARKYRPAAIILDIQLPVIDGWTLLKILKTDEKLKKIPVHVISATDVDKSGGTALAFIKKPVEKNDLEKAFDLIGKHIHSDIKRLLVLSCDHDIEKFLKKAVPEKHTDIICDYVATENEALEKLKTMSYDCIVADIGSQLEKGKKDLQHLQHIIKKDKIPVIIYLDKDLSSKDEVQFKKLSDVIIRDSSQSKDRLMDELELFLYKVQETDGNALPKSSSTFNDEKALAGKKVLLVDDDMRNVFALTNLLEENQMEVITAHDGKEALQQLEDNEGIEIVLMDIMMPEMDGYEATRRIRANQRFAKLPVIALTAKAMQGDREKTIEAGASDYITKPVDSARLFSLMRVWLTA